MDKHKVREMALLALLFFPLAFSCATNSNRIGVNYGQLGNDLPSPSQSIQLLQNMNAGLVKIYDANPEILRQLSGTNMHVSIMVTNDLISQIASNEAAADLWVRENVLPYYPDTMIRFILVGNEILSYNSTQDQRLWCDLVPAMARIQIALHFHNIRNINVGTPLAMDMLESSYPPSSGRFRSDISERIMVPLLDFLERTNSFFFVDVYPYFPWSEDPTNINLDFALSISENIIYTDPTTGFQYNNLLDQMLDSIIFAMTKLGHQSIKLAISETGWPNGGDIEQYGANIHNAATYNRNLVQKMTAEPPLGTPARPGSIIPTFIFSLYDENQKPGPGTERHWGLFYPNGSPIYELDLAGKSSEAMHTALPEATNDRPHQGNIWCVVAKGVSLTKLESALVDICGQAKGTCDAIEPGKECYVPVSAISHASYAFSSYFAKFRNAGATCYFDGLAVQTTRDPSHGACKFPSVSH